MLKVNLVSLVDFECSKFDEGKILIFFSIDASENTGRFGRLVNHAICGANTEVKVVNVNNVPRLVLFARQDILSGDEILYDYGDRDPETRAENQWLCF